jgi:hypothetical protein
MRWYQLGLACALGLIGGIVLGETWEDEETAELSDAPDG